MAASLSAASLTISTTTRANHVARLDAQGNVDLTFDTSNLGLDGTVWAVAPQSDGKVVIGGDFTTAGGALALPHCPA